MWTAAPRPRLLNLNKSITYEIDVTKNILRLFNFGLEFLMKFFLRSETMIDDDNVMRNLLLEPSSTRMPAKTTRSRGRFDQKSLWAKPWRDRPDCCHIPWPRSLSCSWGWLCPCDTGETCWKRREIEQKTKVAQLFLWTNQVYFLAIKSFVSALESISYETMKQRIFVKH